MMTFYPVCGKGGLIHMKLVDNLVNYFSIGAPAIWIDSFEEGVAIDAIYKAARQVCENETWGGYSIFEWSEGFGGHRMNPTNRQPVDDDNDDSLNFELDDDNLCNVNSLPPSAQALLQFVKALQDKEMIHDTVNAEIIIIKEMSDIANDKIKRCIRDLKELGTVKRNNSYYPLVVVAPSGNIPFQLQKLFVTLTCPLPTVPEIEHTINYFNQKHNITWDEEKVNSIANAAAGLTFSEIRRCFDLSYFLKGELDHDIITKEKINAIQKSGILTYRQPKLTIDDIGGHSALKKWIIETKRCMRKDAKKFKVKTARGYLSLGMPGAGKTAIAEAIANYFEVPFVILDLSKIMGGIVGESERNAQAAFQVLDSIGKCVVLLDEVEKNLGGK